jgi:transposase
VKLDVLRTELKRIKRLISRNSGDSSMPPSTDDLPVRGRPAKPVKGSAKRKQGK